jgi:CDP-glucose 4,6-dehydratase
MNREFWNGKRVFLTGHNGFKGSWLALWLQQLGAEVHGFSLDPPTDPNLYSIAQIDDYMATNTFGDICDPGAITAAMQSAEPEIVIHLAAQSLVRLSYIEPAETYAINVMGSINLLEAVRTTSSVRSVVIVTSDKCYENVGDNSGYDEDQLLGGHDPYSSSKACVEILSAAWRRSFLKDSHVALATARAGNVIGGGDWASDRLIPDILNAVTNNEVLQVRSPEAVRPWQHVLEPLSGYIQLSESLYANGDRYAEAWNFGPDQDDVHSVGWIVERLVESSQGASWVHQQQTQPHEAGYLTVDSGKAHSKLGWTPNWRLEKTLEKIKEWHSAWLRGSDMREISLGQISEYENANTPDQSD